MSSKENESGKAPTKVALLDEEGDLTNKFEDAIAYIFQKYCTVPASSELTTESDADDSSISASSRSHSPGGNKTPLLGSRPPNGAVISDVGLDKFAYETNGAPFPQESKDELKQFLDCDDKGRLTYQGFLGLYHLQSDNDLDETWKDLSTHGFQSDLSLVSTRTEGHDDPESAKKSSSNASAQPSSQPQAASQSQLQPTTPSDLTESSAKTDNDTQKADYRTTLLTDLHIRHILKLSNSTSSLHYHLSTHLRINGVYWGLGALELMGKGDLLPEKETVDFVMSCYDETSGGFGPFPRHDAHILNTLSAIQILAIKGRLEVLDREKVIQYILSLRNPSTNLFFGDESRLEEDTRFLYCSVSALAHLNALDRLDTESAISGVLSCLNFDGGFGRVRGAESHAGQVFVCVGALSILQALNRIDTNKLGSWLSERQLKNGGLNGRPEKLEDVCYSWWVLSSLSMISKLKWIDSQKLQAFILSAQDDISGGISDRPGNVSDVFHTFFGITGLALLGYKQGTLRQVDPVYGMPAQVIEKLPGMKRDYQALSPSDPTALQS
ncbi:unnamed protein product [Sympodiomycopsis kandeliae]